MKKSRLFLTTSFFVSCLLLACSEPTQDSIAPVSVPSFDTQAMDSLLSTAVESGEVVGVSSLIFDEGQVVYKGAFGLGDRERNVAVTEESVFRIYSMTKPVTSALIMDLIEEGKIDLNDPVSDYIPQIASMKVASLDAEGNPKFEDQISPITIKDLLLHRSGMGYGIFGDINPVETLYGKAGLFEPSESLSVKMDKLSQLPLLAQPGTGWYYSYSIDVLGRVIEVVTGKSLEEAMHSRLFEPLGMSETGFRVTEKQKPNFVSNYLKQPDGSYRVIEDGQNSPYLNPNNAFESGGGGLVSTLGDFAKFAQMMLDKGTYKGLKILEPETVQMMMSDQMDEDDIFMMPWLGEAAGSGFGYGGSVQTQVTPELILEKGRHVGQWGWGGAARTTFYVDPENNAFGIIMLQFFGGEDPDIHHRWQALSLKETRQAPLEK